MEKLKFMKAYFMHWIGMYAKKIGDVVRQSITKSTAKVFTLGVREELHRGWECFQGFDTRHFGYICSRWILNDVC